MQRLILFECHDQEETEEMSAAAERRRAELTAHPTTPTAAADALPPPTAGVEPAFVFSVVPPVEELKDVTDVFSSAFMLDVVSTWPQPVVSRKRKQMNAAGKDSSGARRGADRGTNASLKTWSSRIRTACAFANFVGSTVCLHKGQPRPTDAEIDRGVRKFFRCLTVYTKLVVTTFLECRRKGYAIAGGGKALNATSLKDYSSGLTFLFAEAKEDGMRGVTAVVPDCCERTSPWQPKGVAEMEEERRARVDSGGYTGNPMATADVRDFRGATNKEARHDGETQLTGAAVTPEMMERLYNEMVRVHSPVARTGQFMVKDAVNALIGGLDKDAARRIVQARASKDSGVGASPLATTSARRCLPGALGGSSAAAANSGVHSDGVGRSNVGIGRDSVDELADREDASEVSEDEKDARGLPALFKAPSNALADFLVYVFYAFAFITIARPITLINLKFKDFSFPDLSVAENAEFFNLYVGMRVKLPLLCLPQRSLCVISGEALTVYTAVRDFAFCQVCRR